MDSWVAEANRRYARLESGEDRELTSEEFWSDDDDGTRGRFEDVLRDALQRPFEERGQLIQWLHESLMTDGEREVQQAWMEECERRLRERDAGTAKSIPGEQVLRELRAKYRKDSGD